MKQEVGYSKKVITALFTLLRFESGGPVPSLILSKAEWPQLFQLADFHDLAHIIGDIVQKLKIALPADIAATLKNRQMAAVFRYENQ